MQKVKISAVSYINSFPFIYGIENSGFINNEYILEKDIPSVCAEKLINNEVDIGLIPVATLPKLKSYTIISDYCIGATGKVNTVLLLSDVSINKIDTILLDYQSRTSVKLVQVLARNFWKIKPKFIQAQKGFENNISNKTAGVIIGDRTFNLQKKYKYKFDLSEEWQKFTNMPFVFAAWTTNKIMPTNFIDNFNNACKFGINNIDKVIEKYNNKNYNANIKSYLENDIDYIFDNKKQKALSLFLSYLGAL